MMLLFWMLVGHAFFDYAGQGDFMAKAKNHKAPIPGVPFYQPLVAHALIHAGAVAFITHSLTLGLCELVAHTLIDYAKCDGRIGYDTDQALHIGCKVLWLAMLSQGIA